MIRHEIFRSRCLRCFFRCASWLRSIRRCGGKAERDGWNLIGVRFGRAPHWAKKSLLFSAPTNTHTAPQIHCDFTPRNTFLVLFHSPPLVVYIISLTAIILRRGLLPSGTCYEPIVSSYRYTLRVILHRGSATPILGRAGSTFTAISWFSEVSPPPHFPPGPGPPGGPPPLGPGPAPTGAGPFGPPGPPPPGKNCGPPGLDLLLAYSCCWKLWYCWA